MCHALTLSAAFLRRRIRLLRLYHRGALRSVGEPGHARPALDAVYCTGMCGSHGVPAV